MHSFADCRHRLLEGLYCYANVRTIQSQTQLAKALAAEIARFFHQKLADASLSRLCNERACDSFDACFRKDPRSVQLLSVAV